METYGTGKQPYTNQWKMEINLYTCGMNGKESYR